MKKKCGNNEPKNIRSNDLSRSKVDHHDLTESEIAAVRSNLLSWYEKNKRSLPWRDLATDSDMNKRSYAVWVSEIMLQQTQVATVIDYYNRWMAKWPRVEDLARASLEEVNEVWSGLGYYSRAKRLHEGARKVVEELNGQMPRTAARLLEDLPGVGRYTSGAIASIAFGEVTGVVDGNVIRVLSRLRAIGADSTSKAAIEKYWELANRLVDNERPGDFNQAQMEFGAMLCTPKSPKCEVCPLKDYCMAFEQVENDKGKAAERLLSTGKSKTEQRVTVIEAIEDCNLCLPKDEPWNSALGVRNYPRKPKKKQAKEELISVCVLERNDYSELKYLIVQRPNKGLLAGLWEFPNLVLHPDWTELQVNSEVGRFLKDEIGMEVDHISDQNKLGEVTHIFSHVHHKYTVHSCHYGDPAPVQLKANGRSCRWVTRQEFQDAAVSTAMRKVFSTYEKGLKSSKTGGNNAKDSRKRKREDSESGKKQASLHSFFKPKV